MELGGNVSDNLIEHLMIGNIEQPQRNSEDQQSKSDEKKAT